MRTNQCIPDPLQQLLTKKEATQEVATIQLGIRTKHSLDSVWLGWSNFLTHKKHCRMLFMTPYEDSVVNELFLLCNLTVYEALGLSYLRV